MSLFSELRRRNVFRVAAAYGVVGWLLTEVSTTILPMFGAPDWVARTIVLVLALGFVPVLIFSWAYELTPEGLKRETVVDPAQSITSHTARKLDFITIAAVVAGIAFLAWARMSPQGAVPETAATSTVATEASVAVLPFVNMSGNSDNEYFSDGLTETLLHMLAQVADLHVAARTSSFAFKGDDRDIREIAATLGVAHVLEGSVQRAGDRVRITAQLIRASDGFHVWSENYDRTLDDIFAIQDEIAHTVSSALSSSLLGDATTDIESVATQSVSAYDLYLKALAEIAKGSYGALQNASALLKDALSQDPDFHDAKSALASLLIDEIGTGLADADATLPRIEALVGQVLAAKPGDAVATATLLAARSYRSTRDGDVDATLAVIENLKTLTHSAPGEVQPRIVLARLLTYVSDYDGALVQLEAARELDPLNASVYQEIGRTQVQNRDFEQARTALLRSLEIEPAQPNAYGSLTDIARRTGAGIDILKYDMKAAEIDPEDHEIPALIAGTLYHYGLFDDGDRFRARTLAVAPTSEVARRTELLRSIYTGDEDLSLQLARRIIEDDVGDRQNTWSIAAETLFFTSTRRGEAAAALAFMDEAVPGFSDFDATDVSGKAYDARGLALGAWRETESSEAAMRRAELLQKHYERIGFKLADAPAIHVSVLALGGATEDAIDVALSDLFSRPVTAYPDWQVFWKQPHLADVAADPRIKAALAQWQQDDAGIAEEMRAYLANYYRAQGA